MKHAAKSLIILFLIAAILPGCGIKSQTYDDLTLPGVPAASAEPSASGMPTAAADLPALRITVLMPHNQALVLSPPADTRLWDEIRRRLGLAADREVKPEFQYLDENTNILTGMIASNSVPDVVVINPYLQYYEKDFTAIQQSKAFRTLTAEDFTRNMPMMVERIKQSGLDFETQCYPLISFMGHTFIPTSFRPDALINVPGSYLVNNMYTGYSITQYNGYALRDDILTKIYPEARTQAALTAVFLDKGSLDAADITGDIPIRTLADLKQYLIQVKNLHLTQADGTTIIPALLDYPAMAAGLFNHGYDKISFAQKPEESSFIINTPEFKELLRWLNEVNEEGLLDPELSANNDDIMWQNAVRGAYAVLPQSYYEALVTYAAKPNYGHRYLPLGYGAADLSSNTNRYLPVRLQAERYVLLSAELSDEDAATIMHWLDYQMTEEFDELCYWGLPEWRTETADARAFKPEYAELQAWAESGAKGEKDGRYYGLLSMPAMKEVKNTLNDMNGDKTLPYDLRMVSFFPDVMGYPGDPFQQAHLPDAVLTGGATLAQYCGEVMAVQDLLPKQQRFLQTAAWNLYESQDYQSFLPHVPNLYYYPNCEDKETLPLMNAVVTGETKDFTKNWAALQQHFNKNGLPQATTAVQQYIAEHWQTGVLDKVITRK